MKGEDWVAIAILAALIGWGFWSTSNDDSPVREDCEVVYDERGAYCG